MQINVTTDYAIRIVLYSAIKKTIVNSGELSKNLGIPKSIVLKLAKELNRNGIVDITTGVNGGIRLMIPPEAVSLYDIINMFEPTTRINRCLEEDQYCSRFATESCPVRKAYVNMQEKIEEYLKSVTISSLL